MYIVAKYLHQEQMLKKDTVVSTVMSNLGFYKSLEKEGIQSVQTQVGDRFVVEEMRKNGYNFGGEQSGHIIFGDLHTTGDGLLSGIQLLYVVKHSGKALSELADEMEVYPQKLVNVKVRDKSRALENERIAAVVKEVEEELGENGRVLVRPSGTEPLLRVMIEASSDELCEQYCQKIVDVVEEELGTD